MPYSGITNPPDLKKRNLLILSENSCGRVGARDFASQVNLGKMASQEKNSPNER
jgi:hypothetical protein